MEIEFDPDKAAGNLRKVVVHTPRGRRRRVISARGASKTEALEYAKGI